MQTNSNSAVSPDDILFRWLHNTLNEADKDFSSIRLSKKLSLAELGILIICYSIFIRVGEYAYVVTGQFKTRSRLHRFELKQLIIRNNILFSFR